MRFFTQRKNKGKDLNHIKLTKKKLKFQLFCVFFTLGTRAPFRQDKFSEKTIDLVSKIKIIVISATINVNLVSVQFKFPFQ